MAVINTDLINVGQLPNDGTGDPLRIAFEKINNNTALLATLSVNGDEGALQFRDGLSFAGSSNLVFDTTNNVLNLGANIVPLTGSNVSIGTSTGKISNVFVSNVGLRAGNVWFKESGNVLTLVHSANDGTRIDLNTGNILAPRVNATTTVFANTTSASLAFTTTSNVAHQIVFETPYLGVSEADFEVISRERLSQNSQTAKIHVMVRNDGSSTKYTITHTLFDGEVLTHYHVDRGYGNIRLMVDPFRNVTIDHLITYSITK
jgi:hypothetical protein